MFDLACMVKYVTGSKGEAAAAGRKKGEYIMNICIEILASS